MTNRHVVFTDDEQRRLRDACRALGTSYAEFVRWAVMQAVDECEGLGRAQRAPFVLPPAEADGWPYEERA